MSPRVILASPSVSRNRSRRRRAPYQPRLEWLEDRTLLTFGTPTPFNTAPRPADVAVADLNNDSILDLVTANSPPSNSVSVLLGNGDGTFQPAQSFAAGPNTIHVAVGDINNDGRLDVVTANFGAGTATLLRGNGDGTLQSAGTITFSTVAFVSNVALANLNADDHLDLIATITNGAGVNRVGVALGSGQGTFQAPVDYAADFFPQEVIVADYNGDGIPDLAVAESGRSVRRFTGNGDGTFQPGVAFTTSSPSPLAMAAADFNGDGILDLVVHDQFGSSVGILAGNPNGTFQFPRFADNRAGSSNDVLAGDINGDGLADIITVNRTSDNISLLLGNGDFTFRTARLFPVAPGTPGARPNGAALGDFNGDGLPDLAVANQVFDTVAIFLNDPAAVSSLRVTAPADATAGAAFTITVSAVTTSGEVATGYRGTVRFTSNDPSATLPANYTFTAADAGERTFTVTLRSPGSRTITATDTVEGSIAGVASVTVTVPLTASRLVVTNFPSPTLAGAVEVFRVTAVDTLGNTVPGYRGTVRFTSSDGQALLPLNYTFTAADAGSRFFGAVLRTAGPQSITVTDIAAPSITGAQTGIIVNPAAASTLVASGFPSPVTAGTPGIITVTARDPFGNVATGYRGAVRFTSNDAQALLPPSYTFTAADNGSRAFAAVLRTAGSRALTVLEITGPLTGTQSGITVNPALVSSLAVSGFPSPTVAGTARTFTVTAVDAFGNTVPSYRGTVRFTSTDTQALLPANYTFAPADNGSRTFNATLRTTGTQSLTASDIAGTAVTGTQGGIAISPAATSTLLVTGFPSPVTAGTVGGFTVTARDPFGNTATGYRGTVRFTSTDGQATLPDNYTFTAADNGSHAFGAILRAAGSRNITATDTAATAITGSQTGIVVNPGATIDRFTISAPAGVNTEAPFPVTVTARDQFGNVFTGYRGTVRFASTDPAATLPANYTFTAVDAGVRNFTITVRTPGSQTLTVQDTESATLTGSVSVTVIQVQFAARINFGVGARPVAVAWGDLNHDGHLDLVSANNANSVSVLIGNGDGIFRTAVHYATGAGTTWVVVADFSNDGNLDAATGNEFGSSVTILLGRGDGTFQTATSYPAGSGTGGLAVGDYNGDGNLDIAAGTIFGSGVSVLLGNGDGSFRPPVFYPTGTFARNVTTADFNGDGILDLATNNQGLNTVGVLRGNGNGTFQPAVSYSVGSTPTDIFAADLNLDGVPDVITANHSGGSLSVLVNNGDGTFRAAVNYPGVSLAHGVSVGDFDHDGFPDLVAVSRASHVIGVFYGNGDGTFGPVQTFATGLGPFGLTVADFNADGSPDVATANGDSNDVSILLNAIRPPTRVQGVILNDGSPQRSQVSSLTVFFTSVVTLQPGAFEVFTADGRLVDITVTATIIDARTIAVLTFSGDDVVGGSLADGNYTLVIRGDRVRDPLGRALDGDGDGTPGGDYTEAFFRLFGDTDGDRDVDEDDQALFDAAFGSGAGDPSYLAYLDFNGDGFIDETDQIAFTASLGSRLEP